MHLFTSSDLNFVGGLAWLSTSGTLILSRCGNLTSHREPLPSFIVTVLELFCIINS